MKTGTYMDENKLALLGIEALIEKLGMIETNRFISLSFNRRLESVKRHHLWQSKLNKDDFFKKVF